MKDLLIGAFIGAFIATGIGMCAYPKALKRVQVFSQAQIDTARAEVVQVSVYAAAQQRRGDSLERVRQPVILQAHLQTASAEQLELSLADQKSTADSNLVLRAENRALRGAVVNLWSALQQSNQIIAAERARGDSLGKALATVTFRFGEVNDRLQHLKGPPKWLTITWHAVAAVGIAKLAYDVGRHDRCHAETCQPVTTGAR